MAEQSEKREAKLRVQISHILVISREALLRGFRILQKDIKIRSLGI
jgi:hypothetical protein